MSQNLRPETYMMKAEQDIRAAQVQASLAEPPWDGYCGLVQVCDEEVLSLPNSEVHGGGPSKLKSSSSKGRYKPAQSPKEDSSSSIHSNGKDGKQSNAVKEIMYQIKRTSRLPEAERSAHLEKLAHSAFETAKVSDKSTATQLLKLAEFACPNHASELKSLVKAALRA